MLHCLQFGYHLPLLKQTAGWDGQHQLLKLQMLPTNDHFVLSSHKIKLQYGLCDGPRFWHRGNGIMVLLLILVLDWIAALRPRAQTCQDVRKALVSLIFHTFLNFLLSLNKIRCDCGQIARTMTGQLAWWSYHQTICTIKSCEWRYAFSLDPGISLVVISCSLRGCLAQPYCSGICMRESDVYAPCAVFLYCQTQSCHWTDSDGCWHQDASGHTQAQPSSPAAVCHCSTEEAVATEQLQNWLFTSLLFCTHTHNLLLGTCLCSESMFLSSWLSKGISISILGILAEFLSFKCLHTFRLLVWNRTAALWQRLVEDSKIMLLASGQSHEISWNPTADKVCSAPKVKRISAPR